MTNSALNVEIPKEWNGFCRLHERCDVAKQYCRQVNLLNKLTDMILLRSKEIDDKIRERRAEAKRLPLGVYLSTLKELLEEYVRNGELDENKYEELNKIRKQEAIWDLTYATFKILADTRKILSPAHAFV